MRGFPWLPVAGACPDRDIGLAFFLFFLGVNMASARDRALLIIELLARHVNGLPITEISEQLSIPRTATHRLLGDLKAMGYVKQQVHTGQYMLTVKLASLGLGYLAATGINDVALPFLEDLAQATGELVRMAVIEGDSLTWVAKAQGASCGLRYDPDAGMDVYLPASANGLAWLAAESEERAMALITQQGLADVAQKGPGAPHTLAELLAALELTRQRGYATVKDAYEAGTSAVAAVIRNSVSGRPIGTVSVAGPTVRMNADRLEQMAPLVLACASELSLASKSSPLFSA